MENLKTEIENNILKTEESIKELKSNLEVKEYIIVEKNLQNLISNPKIIKYRTLLNCLDGYETALNNSGKVKISNLTSSLEIDCQETRCKIDEMNKDKVIEAYNELLAKSKKLEQNTNVQKYILLLNYLDGLNNIINKLNEQKQSPKK